MLLSSESPVSSKVTNYGETNINNVSVIITTNSTYRMERKSEVFNYTAPYYNIGSFGVGVAHFSRIQDNYMEIFLIP